MRGRAGERSTKNSAVTIGTLPLTKLSQASGAQDLKLICGGRNAFSVELIKQGLGLHVLISFEA